MNVIEPRVDRIRLTCRDCEGAWLQPVLSLVPASVWTAYAKTVRCPECGASWNRLAWPDTDQLAEYDRASKEASLHCHRGARRWISGRV